MFSVDFGPRDTGNEIAYDVDQLHDELPQPYRMVNRLINDLVAMATDMTFVDRDDRSLDTGRLDWQVKNGATATAAAPCGADLLAVLPSAALPVGQLVAWSAVSGTPYRIAVEQSGALVAYVWCPQPCAWISKPRVCLSHSVPGRCWQV